MASTESQFHIAMLALHQRALDQCDYDAKLFKTMVLEHGGLEAARRLLAAPKVHDGLVKLFEKRRLDLTLEALVLLPEWRELSWSSGPFWPAPGRPGAKKSR